MENFVEVIVNIKEEPLHDDLQDEKHEEDGDELVNIKEEPLQDDLQDEKHEEDWDELKEAGTEMDQNFKCAFCRRLFKRQKWLEKHVKLAHFQQSNNGKLKCGQCDEWFSTKSELDQHERDVHTGCGIKCALCEFQPSGQTELENHIQKYHTVKWPYKCDFCGRTFQCKRYQDQHQQRTMTMSYKCETCGQIFCKQGALTRHIKSVHKPNVCDECGNRFTTASSLKTHFDTMHLGIRRFPCNLCDKRFKQKSHLIKHLKFCNERDSSP